MDTTTNENFRRIGQGFCGTVWAQPGENTVAVKREDGGPGRSLYNDYTMHLSVLKSSQSSVRIPRCHKYVRADDQEWWTAQTSRFPTTFQVACNALVTPGPWPKPWRTCTGERI